MKSALITGVTGQDGRHLAKLLTDKGYKVYGMINGQKRELANELTTVQPDVIQVWGDLADSASLNHVIAQTNPDEIYNLGAISFVGISFTQPELTCNITGMGVVRLLEAVRTVGNPNHTRIYQASSSEMFGKVQQIPQTELTKFYPRSPYGVAKTMAHNMCVNYREAYNMHISCGILFNHEGELRGYEFVTRKISQAVARIYLGLQTEIQLGNLEAKRDWGYAGDYVDAMWRMLQQDTPDDYVIATGEMHSVREFLEEAFSVAGIKDGVQRHVKINRKFMRPSEVELLVGDASKAHSKLGWRPSTNFRELVKLMVENDIEIESRKIR